MTRVKKPIFIIMSLFSILIVSIGLVVFIYFHIEKKESIEKLDAFLSEKNYENNIKEKDILYDWKLGTYYMKVVFIDEPENLYEFYVEDDSNNVYVIGFNKNKGVEITDKNKGKYIDD